MLRIVDVVESVELGKMLARFDAWFGVGGSRRYPLQRAFRIVLRYDLMLGIACVYRRQSCRAACTTGKEIHRSLSGAPVAFSTHQSSCSQCSQKQPNDRYFWVTDHSLPPKTIIRTSFCAFHVAIHGILSQSCESANGPQPEKHDTSCQSVNHGPKTPCISGIIPTSNVYILLFGRSNTPFSA